MNNEELRLRVKAAKKKLKASGLHGAKIKFFDESFGVIYKQKSMRYDNLWAGYIVDEMFTETLESFVKKNVI